MSRISSAGHQREADNLEKLETINDLRVPNNLELTDYYIGHQISGNSGLDDISKASN